MPMLENLCTGKEQSQNIVIEDVTEVPGRLLVLVVLHNMCQRYDQVLLLASERPPHFFLNALPASLRQRIQIVAIPSPKKAGERLAVGPLIATTRSAIWGTGVLVGVVMDSVSGIVFTHSLTAVPQLVRSLLDYGERGNKVKQVVSLVHTGVHEESARQIISGRPDTLIQLLPPSSPHHQYSCLIRHGNTWQHPAPCTEEFNISADFLHVQDVISKPRTHTVQTNTTQQQQADPAANLTFNLSLKPEERAAKDQVVLPYTQISSSESPGGVIHYIPDEDDDFDDEDPDEDLDF